ncbi:MAG: Lpg1974 family pore-forming outer membrane protein [Parachlamydiaceae bacterium]
MKKWLSFSLLTLQCCALQAWDPCCDDICSNYYAEASWLYWQADSSNYDFVNITTSNSTSEGNLSENNNSERDLSQKMPWDSGFRIGLGFDLPCWGMDVKATWTDFHSSGTKKLHVTQPTDDSVQYYTRPFMDGSLRLDSSNTAELKAKQKISFAFDPVNLEFGKWICFDCVSIVLRPHIGLQYLQYKDHRKFVDTFSFLDEGNLISGEGYSKMKQKFQGFGVRGGFDARLPLFCDISLVGSVAASIDWGRNKIHFDEQVDSMFSNGEEGNQFIQNSNLSKHYHHSQTLIDLGIGFRWDTCLCDCYNIELEALWEQHQLINGSKFWANLQGNEESIGFHPDMRSDLSVRGLTLKAAVSF